MRHIDCTILEARAILGVWRPWFRDTSTWDSVRKASLTYGRRAGKSFMLALIAAYFAIFRVGGPLSTPVPLWPAQVI
jgi:hypothetical protein